MPIAVNVTLTIDEAAAVVITLRGDPLAQSYRRHAESAAEKVARAGKVAQMGIGSAPGPSIESAARAACEVAP